MKNVKRLPAGIAVLGTLLMLAGCAFGTRHVTLTYPPASEGALVPGTAEASTLPPDASAELTLVTFTDRRSNKEKVGDVQNALGMRTASVATDSNVAEWVTQALKLELEKVGYRVKTISKATQAATGPILGPTLGGEILNLHCSAYWTYEGEITIFAKLEADDQKLLAKEYTGKGSAGTNWAMTEKSYGISLSNALVDALEELVQDINIAMAGK